MKKLLLIVVVIAAAIYGFNAWYRQQTANVAKLRVQGMLHAMADNDPQTAIGLWAENRAKLDMAGLAAYQLHFETFWHDSGLAAGSGWDVTSVQRDPNGHEHLVTVQSGDQKVVLRVPTSTKISFVPPE